MKCKFLVLLGLLLFCLAGCGQREKIDSLSQLSEKEFAVPTGTIIDQLVLSKIPDAKFKYFNTALDCCLAVKGGKADVAAYDVPQLRNIVAKVPGLKVLPEMITIDEYGFAVNQHNPELKAQLDTLLDELKTDGRYDAMMERWIPKSGAPAPMPQIKEISDNGVLRFGTSAVTEPFAFLDNSREIVGIDIEIARLLALRLHKKLEIVDMDFGAVIPSLAAGKVDLIGACITISEERKEKVLFSQPYYIGGIAALVKE